MCGIVSEDVSKQYRKVRVLRSVSFSVSAGEVLLLAGKNGAGKTTWIRVALGLASASGGRVAFSGRDVRGARDAVAFVPDEPAVYPGLSGHANLRILSGIRKPSPRRVSCLREALALDESFLRMRARGYSLGQRRRLAIAAALLREPAYLFLDEPTVGLDPSAWDRVRTALLALAGDGTTVILTGQDFGEMQSLAGRIAVLHAGSIAFEGAVQELLRRRRPRVRVASSMVHEIAARLGRECTSLGPDRIDINCLDDREAQVTLEAARSLRIPLQSLSIEHDTLEEAFLALLLEHERFEA